MTDFKRMEIMQSLAGEREGGKETTDGGRDFSNVESYRD